MRSANQVNRRQKTVVPVDAGTAKIKATFAYVKELESFCYLINGVLDTYILQNRKIEGVEEHTPSDVI